MLKNISEERDSDRTALQIMTKEINAHKEKDLPSQPVSADPDAEHGGWSIQQNTWHNRRSSRNTKSSPNSEDSHSGANNNNKHTRKPVTVITTLAFFFFFAARGLDLHWAVLKIVVNHAT